MITVIGKLQDTEKYKNVYRYNVMPELDNWTPGANIKWLEQAINHRDDILITSLNDISGFFAEELEFLLSELKKRKQK